MSMVVCQRTPNKIPKKPSWEFYEYRNIRRKSFRFSCTCDRSWHNTEEMWEQKTVYQTEVGLKDLPIMMWFWVMTWQHTELSCRDTEVVSSTELSLDMSDVSSVDSGCEPIFFNGSRSMGCQDCLSEKLGQNCTLWEWSSIHWWESCLALS
jgi:hypothetical protein